MSVKALLDVAAAEVGYEETGGPSGHDGNITKYWAELQPDFQGQPWCAGFVSWAAKHSGHPLPAIDHPWAFSYCPDAVRYAQAHGLWSSSGRYAPGDIVLFCFDGSGNAEHTGIVVSDDGATLHTIEGNTEPTNSGDQANGGGVYRKNRPHGPSVLGVLQWSKVLAGDVTPPPPATGGDRWLGLHNPPMTGQDVTNAIHALNVAGNHLDEHGGYTEAVAQVVAVFQHNRQITERGVGPKTWQALRRVVGH